MNKENKGILSQIRRRFDVDIYDNYCSFSLKGENQGKIIFTIESCPLYYCCGVTELGDFSITFDDIDESSFPEKEVLVMVEHFLEAKMKRLSPKSRSSQKIMFMTCLIDNRLCNLIRKVVESLPEKWHKVNEFVNANSGNTVDVWMTK